ncbi:MAG: DNA/RNA nuclease SfsA [Bacillota bacterium]|nr:DNA/RNA nuclease SfsA [Bacillota bacterium]
MKTDKNVYRARFIERPNRFIAYVNINGEKVKVHVPNTGRCREILTRDTDVILREENSITRTTKYDLICGYKGDKIINIDSQIPNSVVHEALANKKIKKLSRYKIIEREKTYKNSRFDFKLSFQDEIYYLEVKGVTLEENGHSMFPDAPTERGRKHLLELIEAKKEGYGAGVLFLAQMDNIKSFSPNFKMDPLFSKALIECSKNGVDIFAYESSVAENSITLKDEIEIILDDLE